MPIYEFECKGCGKSAELLVPTSDWKGAKCPACGSTRLVKKLSVFAVSGGGRESSAAAMPACTGNPGACGRCNLN